LPSFGDPCAQPAAVLLRSPEKSTTVALGVTLLLGRDRNSRLLAGWSQGADFEGHAWRFGPSFSRNPAKHVWLLLNLLRWQPPSPSVRENIAVKPNYHQAKRQRELARKARQQQKQQRRSDRARSADASPAVEPLEHPAGALGTRVPARPEDPIPSTHGPQPSGSAAPGGKL